MGYTTKFEGSFKLNMQLDESTIKLLKGIYTTRRMKRDINKLSEKFRISKQLAELKYGIDGEFYYNEEDFPNFGQNDNDETIIDYNKPPGEQPNLWCQWKYFEDHNIIAWDGDEKFYNYVEWIEYIIKHILSPRKYKLNGEVKWIGEESDDRGTIIINKNDVMVIQYVKKILKKQN
jgi:hypothetical protein